MEFKISIDYDDYFANSSLLKAYHIEVVGDSIMFHTNKDTIKILEEKNIRYMLHYSKRKNIKEFFKNKTGLIVGILCVCFLILMNSFRVSKVIFNGNYPINNEIETYIKEQNQQILFFEFHKNNYEYLSKELRSVFNEYEWISITKKGSVIYVEVEPTTSKEIGKIDNTPADIIASKSGIVYEYKTFNGKAMVTANSYIKKGEVLIAGGNDQAKGYVLATVFEEVTIEVPKKEKISQYSGKTTSYNQVMLFGKGFNVSKNINYVESDLTIKRLFNIPYFISVNKIEEYEKNDIIYVYDKNAALQYAESIIVDNFTKNKVLNEERILRIEDLIVTEDDTSFKITFLVKKIESIGELKKHL